MLWLTFESRLQGFADACGKAVVPRRLDQNPTNMSVTCLCQGSSVSRRPTGMLAWHQTQIAHQFTGMRETPQITEFGDNGRGRQEINGPQRHEGIDHG